ncbi:hypothetical protein N7448_011303 [Penicillium atrosanguineum]|nr:hypothetical protein N7448_011303 [Penicillium atrosanguineum]
MEAESSTQWVILEAPPAIPTVVPVPGLKEASPLSSVDEELLVFAPVEAAVESAPSRIRSHHSRRATTSAIVRRFRQVSRLPVARPSPEQPGCDIFDVPSSPGAYMAPAVAASPVSPVLASPLSAATAGSLAECSKQTIISNVYYRV